MPDRRYSLPNATLADLRDMVTVTRDLPADTVVHESYAPGSLGWKLRGVVLAIADDAVPAPRQESAQEGAHRT